ncbi:MAG: lysophospholipid acyltransferase family protein [Candidatus Omnitrophica bacterium]|nr:lysophospholipid acyltransferase family protein [Candidatus Omnitrophota bacterium]
MKRQLCPRLEALFGRLLLEISSLIIWVTPELFLYRVAKVLGVLLFLILGRQRRIAINNLEQAYTGKISSKQCYKIAQGCFINMAQSGAELLGWLKRKHRVVEKVNFENLEILKKALAQKNGVILVSAHLGNFPLIPVRLGFEAIKTAVIMRPIREARLIQIFKEIPRQLDIELIPTVPRSACVLAALRSLRNNRCLLLLLDQNFGTGGVFADFFGRKAATATGPVVLAQRSNAVIIPCFIIRKPDNTHTIFFEPEFKITQFSSEQETIVKNIQALTELIENYIRRYPQQWTWIHRRWKVQPRYLAQQ